MPIPDLGPERFEVTIDGRKRRVVSANFVRSVTSAHDSDPPIVSAAARAETGPVPGARHGRLFMVAIDVNSFSVGDSRGVVSAATGFIKALRPEDQVGLFSFPVGERAAPTTDKLSVITKLNTIVGAKQSMESSPSLAGGGGGHHGRKRRRVVRPGPRHCRRRGGKPRQRLVRNAGIATGPDA